MPQPALLLCLPELQPRPRPEPAEELGVDLRRTQQDHAAHLPLGLSSSSVGPDPCWRKPWAMIFHWVPRPHGVTSAGNSGEPRDI